MRMRWLLLLCLSAVPGWSQTAAPPPRPGDTVGMHTVRDGETLESITTKYLGSPRLWRENARLNPQLKNPNALRPGQRIRVILSRQIVAQNAEITRLSKRVEQKPEPQPWTRARQGDRLRARHGIRTFDDASAELQFDDGSSLTLTERSMVFLRGAAPRRELARSAIEIVNGQADVSVSPNQRADEGIEVIVGEARTRPKPSSDGAAVARTRKAAGGAAQVMVYGGSSEVEAGGRKVAVARGEGTTARPGAVPSPPEKLLPAPLNLATSSDSITWSAVSGAVSYTIEVCADADCGVLIERTTGIKETTLPLTALPPGRYFCRVTAVSRSGLDGFPSDSQPIAIVVTISGIVFEDLDPALPGSDRRVLQGVAIRLFRDGGDGRPDGRDDQPVAQDRSDAIGLFRFEPAARAAYWVVVDSRSIRPERLKKDETAWAEQSYAGKGGLCSEVLRSEIGECFGGRLRERPDDAATLATAEHVARADVREGDAGGISFGFSFALISKSSDLETQGSFRQFVRNANALAGRDASFVAGSQSVELQSPLVIRDDETVVEGRTTARETAETFASGRSRTLRRSIMPSNLTLRCGSLARCLSAERGTTLRNLQIDGAGTLVDASATLAMDNVRLGSSSTSIALRLSNDARAVVRKSTLAASGRVVDAAGARVTIEESLLQLYGEGSTPAVSISGTLSMIRASRLTALSTGRTAVVLEGGASHRVDDSSIVDFERGIELRKSRSNAITNNVFDTRGTSVAIDAASSAEVLGNVFEKVKTPISNPGPQSCEAARVERVNGLDVRGSACAGAVIDVYEVDVSGEVLTAVPVDRVEAAADATFLSKLTREVPAIGLVVIDREGNSTPMTIHRR